MHTNENESMREFEKQLQNSRLGEKSTQVLRLAQSIANEQKDFFLRKGPGRGDRSTAEFIQSLHEQLAAGSGGGFVGGIEPEKTFVDSVSGARVDFWIPAEQTIIEIALGLRNPLSEFERDVLKALIARDEGIPISTLVLLGKPSALKRTSAPWCQHVIKWAATRGLRVCVLELVEKGQEGGGTEV
jgi:hypothetical protein